MFLQYIFSWYSQHMQHKQAVIPWLPYICTFFVWCCQGFFWQNALQLLRELFDPWRWQGPPIVVCYSLNLQATIQNVPRLSMMKRCTIWLINDETCTWQVEVISGHYSLGLQVLFWYPKILSNFQSSFICFFKYECSSIRLQIHESTVGGLR